MTENQDTHYTFPCEFNIKIVGLANDAFETVALTIVHTHAPDIKENAIRSRLSKDGKYLALTITVTATSKAQLDAIYQDLTAAKEVIMAL